MASAVNMADEKERRKKSDATGEEEEKSERNKSTVVADLIEISSMVTKNNIIM